ncbi:MAG: aminotransferase class V-fold PLP-dependent enzyme [Hydrogeniiclostridium sp.]
MMYFDNAATTYPKPTTVNQAVERALRLYGANPGRAGHAMSMRTAEEIYQTRSEIAEFFNAAGPECVVFTPNCTAALNYVIKGILKPGDHVVTSNLEHNAVMRPLEKLSDKGITYTAVEVTPGDNDKTVDAFRKALKPNTALVVCTHVSNVWGIRLPVERITALVHQYGIPLCLDAAQSAGVFPIQMGVSCDYLCIAPHKGLYAPMGTGILITCMEKKLDTLIEGGTGTNSISLEQPETLPDRFESGTVNVPGICGIRAGLRFVRSKGLSRVLEHETMLMRRLYRSLAKSPKVQLYTPEPEGKAFAPVFSFNVEGMGSEEVGSFLARQGAAVRAGLHCAPCAHKTMGTLETGAVRCCPSVFTTERDVATFASFMRKIL